jgi:hypothetical protein
MLKWTGDGRDDVAHLRGSANLLYNAFRRRCDNNRDRRLLWRGSNRAVGQVAAPREPAD